MCFLFCFFFVKYWQMIQSLHRLFVFQRVTPTPYNSALGAERGMCSPGIHAHFVLAYEPKRMTSGLRAVQPPLRLCPTECFTVFCAVWFWGSGFTHFSLNSSEQRLFARLHRRRLASGPTLHSEVGELLFSPSRLNFMAQFWRGFFFLLSVFTGP